MYCCPTRPYVNKFNAWVQAKTKPIGGIAQVVQGPSTFDTLLGSHYQVFSKSQFYDLYGS